MPQAERRSSGGATAAVLLQGAAFALVAVGYAAARAARSRPALQNGSGARTRAITGALLLALAAGAALVLGPRLPGADASARTIWRTQLEPPFDVSQYPSPLAGYRRYTEPNAAELYDRPLYAVTALQAIGAYVRYRNGAVRAAALRAFSKSIGDQPEQDGD